MIKKFILNADDFGLSKAINRAVLEGYEDDILKSASLVANGEFFDNAIDVISKCPNLGIGIHLNLIEGKSLCEDVDKLTDSKGYFNNSFINLLLKCYFSKDEEFFSQMERELRRQIEKIMSKTPVTHIDSHVHVHAIPKIFNLVCRLANEYGIKQVRTQFEKPYFVPNLYKHFTWKYPINLIKMILLGFFTVFNEATVHKYKLKTNDYLVGITYTSMMDSLSVSYGVMAVKLNKVTVEALIHPCRYDDGTIDNHFNEYMITKNKKLKEKIINLGYEITNYVEE